MQVGSSTTDYQNQMQMRKMDGTGGGMGMRRGGQGGNGMGAIMQSLPTDDRVAIQDQMQSLSESDKAAAIDKIKQLDTTSMSTDAITQSIMDIINPTTSTDETTSLLASLYA